MAKGNRNTAMEMKEMRALMERGFGELNARQNKLDQSISKLKESIESSKAPKKGENSSSSPTIKAEDEKDDDLSISMDAVVEYSHPYSGRLCVTGYHEKRPLTILFGLGGSSHNFIDESLADKLGCESYPIEPRTVESAVGKTVTSRACNNFELSVQGIVFNVKVYLLPLSSNCEMVLGNQWLGTVENFILDSKGMAFSFRGQKHFVRLKQPIHDGEGSNR